MEVLIYNSFTYNNGGGNPAGIVLVEEDFPSDQVMLAIADEVGLSETAFVKQIDDSLFETRFFTPVDEVPLCGHATIAVFHHLSESGRLHQNHARQKTKAGTLAIKIQEIEGRRFVMMAQAEPFSRPIPSQMIEDIYQSVGITSIDLALKPLIVSTGIEDIILPIDSREKLNAMTVSFDAIRTLSQTLNVCGIHAFAIENGIYYTRNFAPLYGIDEESATGTSSGALCYYAFCHDSHQKTPFEITCLQGESMGLTSQIMATYDDGIWVGGYCTYKTKYSNIGSKFLVSSK